MHTPEHRSAAQSSAGADYTLRPIRAGDWRQARDLRLRALQDEDAAVAFFTTHDEAAARTDEQWRSSARELSAEAALPVGGRQFVATDPAGEWVATVTVRLETEGAPAFGGGVVARDRGMLLAVWIDPVHRGRGLLERMIDLAEGWLAELGVHSLGLWVHEDNARARRAYAAVGFEPTGGRVVDRIGPEIELIRPL